LDYINTRDKVTVKVMEQGKFSVGGYMDEKVNENEFISDRSITKLRSSCDILSKIYEPEILHQIEINNTYFTEKKDIVILTFDMMDKFVNADAKAKLANESKSAIYFYNKYLNRIDTCICQYKYEIGFVVDGGFGPEWKDFYDYEVEEYEQKRKFFTENEEKIKNQLLLFIDNYVSNTPIVQTIKLWKMFIDPKRLEKYDFVLLEEIYNVLEKKHDDD
jgi:hypothetical protein